MFWDQVAGVYDIFVNVINRKTHQKLKSIVSDLIEPGDHVLECACGTGLLSAVAAAKCKHLVATDFSEKMLKRAEKNCVAYANTEYRKEDITSLSFPDRSFDKVLAGNVIHLLDEPLKALAELDRVCKDGGTLIIPTYMNKDSKGKTSGFVEAAGKAGADFKRQFTMDSYKQFFLAAGYSEVKVILAEGRIPCAVAVMKKRRNDRKEGVVNGQI